MPLLGKGCPMRLSTLLAEISPNLKPGDFPDLEIRRICEDSRTVQPGDLFVARPGTQVDGARFLNDARQRGAVAAVVSVPAVECPLPQVVVEDVNRAASIAGNALHD